MYYVLLSPAVFQNGSIKSDNVKATYNGTKWTTEKAVNYSPTYQYYAYYPYSTSGLAHLGTSSSKGSIATIGTSPASGAQSLASRASFNGTSSANASFASNAQNASSSASGTQAVATRAVSANTSASDFFASGISAFTPATNQSTATNFNASDLQVAKGTINRTDASDVTFSLERQMNLVQLSSSGSQEIFVADDATQTSTDGTPYTVTPYSSGSNYCAIVKSPSGKTAAVTYEYVLALKDIFYTDGSLSHYSASLLSGKTPVAIIFKIGTTTADAALGYTHGYGIALKQAGEYVQWYYDTTTDQPNFVNWASRFNNTASDIETMIKGDYNGLTQYNALKDNASSTDAFGSVRLFATQNVIKRGVWFLPSEGQLWDMFNVLSDYEIGNSTPRVQGCGVYYEDDVQLVQNMEKLSQKFSSEYYDPIIPLSTDTENFFIWSSSEYNATNAMKFNVEVNCIQKHFFFSGDHPKERTFAGQSNPKAKFVSRACMTF